MRKLLDLTRRYDNLILPNGNLASKQPLGPLKREVERLIGPLSADAGKDVVLEAYRDRVVAIAIELRQHRVSGVQRTPTSTVPPVGQIEIQAAVDRLNRDATEKKKAA